MVGFTAGTQAPPVAQSQYPPLGPAGVEQHGWPMVGV